MSKRKPLSYQEKLNSISDYTTLGINSKKYKAKNPNFSRSEKILITKYYNLMKSSGYFDYNSTEKEFYPKVKIIKSKKKKQKGSPRLAGYIVQGAAPGDKVINGEIIKGNFKKKFFPMDFSDLPPDDESGEFDEAAIEAIYEGLGITDWDLKEEKKLEKNPDYEVKEYPGLKFGNYFTIVLQNGWELGQRKGKEVDKNKRVDGQAIAKDLSGDKKFLNLTDKIIEMLRYGKNQYKMGTLQLVTGVYLWEFLNQRKPNKKEMKAIKGKRRKGKKK